MTYYYEIITSGLGCFLLTIILVPLSMKVGTFIGALDYPGEIKIHSTPTPRFGGMAIFSSIFLTSFIFPSIVNHLNIETKLLIILSVSGIFLLGVLDDVKNLNANFKLILQMINVVLAVVGLFTLQNSFSIVYFFIIFIFILGYTNSFNLIDGMDGLASGIAVFISLGLIAISLLAKQQVTLFGASLIICASLGFLIFNLNPAKTFLGDCGSTLLGFSLGIIISIIWLNSTNKFVFLPLLMIAGIPIIDTSSIIIRRLINRKSLFVGDRNHLYDLIMQKGYNIKQTLLFIYSVGLFLTIIGIILYILVEL